MSRILCLWSGPRNISTAMMRSFGSQSDVTCWDEPFFAAYLKQTGLDHPGRAETLAQCETDPARVVERVIGAAGVDNDARHADGLGGGRAARFAAAPSRTSHCVLRKGAP